MRSVNLRNSTPQRIVVTGLTGSGKTTLAHEISRRLGIKHVELDALHWGPDWTARSTEEFVHLVAGATLTEEWVACGNYYSKLKELTWQRATLIVWLDLPRYVSLIRMTRRTITRIVTREQLWHGNKETFRNVFLDKESLLVWWWQTQRLEPERTLQRIAASPQAVGLRLKSVREVNKWLKRLG